MGHLRKCASCHCSDSCQKTEAWIVLRETNVASSFRRRCEPVKAAVFLKAHHDIWKKGEQFLGRSKTCLCLTAPGLSKNVCWRGGGTLYSHPNWCEECSFSIDCEWWRPAETQNTSLAELGREEFEDQIFGCSRRQ